MTSSPTPAVLPDARANLDKVLTDALYLAVATLAFHGRDRGTDRQERMLDGLEKLAKELDPRIRAARDDLRTTPPASDAAVPARPVMRMEVIREWVGGERYARDYEYCDATFKDQADRVLALFAAAPKVASDTATDRDASTRSQRPPE